MSKTIRNFISIAILLLFVALFVLSIVASSQAIELLNSQIPSSHYLWVDFRDYMRTMSIVDIIASSIILAVIVIGIYLFITDKDINVIVFPVIAIIFSICNLISAVIGSGAGKLLAQINNQTYSLPAISIALIVIVGLMFFISVSAIYVHNKASHIITAIAYVLWLVVLIISTVILEASSLTEIVVLVFEFVTVASIILLSTYCFLQDERYIQHKNKAASKRSVEERLAKAKLLLESHLISAEEYNAKKEEILKDI